MARAPRLVVALAPVALALAAGGAAQAGGGVLVPLRLADYAPTLEGTLLVTEEAAGGAPERVESRVLAPTTVGGRTISPRVVSHGADERTRFFALTASDLSLIATQRAGAEPLSLKQPLVLLAAPLRTGASWRYPYALDGLDQRVVAVTATIAAVNERVTTRAGAFHRCLRVKSTADVDAGGTTVAVRGDALVCPGVGVVRSALTETVTAAGRVLSRADESLELVAYALPAAANPR